MTTHSFGLGCGQSNHVTSIKSSYRRDSKMPELPEVETCRRALEPVLVGQTIGRYAHSTKRLREQAQSSEMAELAGLTISALERRSKYLVIRAQSELVLVHLGMTGQLFVSDESTPPWLDHEHWRLELSSGWLRYRDPRRFGMLIRCSQGQFDEHPRIKNLGPEPLLEAWTDDDFLAICKTSSRPIKTLIMDAATVVGVGNIYAAEALFAAGIDPRRSASRIAPRRLRRLKLEIVRVLNRALESGGSTIRNFVSSDGAPGYFAQQLAVYGRAGKRCRQCEAVLTNVILGGRSTVFCRRCQR